MNKTITLNTGRKIGPKHPAYIIAEIGSNHDGSLKKALKLISLAKKAGADAVKFQSFSAESLVNPLILKNNKWVKEPAFSILEELTVPKEWYPKLKKQADKEKIDFLSTPFDLTRLEWLHELNVPLIKIASGDLTNFELLTKAAILKKPIVISTGAALLNEIKIAVEVLKKAKAKDIAILQCVSCYPTAIKDANILAMKTLEKRFKVPVGYSDHAPGIVVPLGAIAHGASIIEKHFTDDKTLKGPDHPHSLNPGEFEYMVKSIREMEKALGNEAKKPVKEELSERVMARKAAYAMKDIKKGEKMTREHIKLVRHAFPHGIPASDLNELLGKIAKQDISEHEMITWNMVKK